MILSFFEQPQEITLQPLENANSMQVDERQNEEEEEEEVQEQPLISIRSFGMFSSTASQILLSDDGDSIGKIFNQMP